MIHLNHVFIRLLDTCNLQCAHCYSSCGPSAASQLSLETVLKIVEQLSAINTNHVHLEGGEAFIYKGIWEVIDALNAVGLKPAITSNGLIVNDNIISRIAGCVSKLTFSIDGPTAEVHDQIRRRTGSFDRVTKAVRLSKAAGIPTHMISVVWKESVKRVRETVQLAEELGVDRLLLFSCGNIGAAIKNWEELSCDNETWFAYLETVRELAATRPWMWFEVDRVRRSDLADYITSEYKPICVRSPRDSVTIDPLGNVYPCGYFIPYNKSLGNVKDTKLLDIVTKQQDGERYSGACSNPWKVKENGVVELCKLFSVNYESLPTKS